MSVIQYFVLRSHMRGQPVYDSEDEGAGFEYIIAAILIGLLLVMAGFVLVNMQYKPVGTYQVDGTVLAYSTTSGKSPKVTVWLHQHDGVRNYSTSTSVKSCVYAPIGTHIPVKVTNEVNAWTSQTRQSVALVYNPCKGVR